MDAWIDGKAEATLLFNSELNSFEIDTDVKMGMVTLTGQVDTEAERKLAVELIKEIDGVKDVSNELVVVRENVIEGSAEDAIFIDAEIETVITRRLLSNSEISGRSINVDVEGLKVTLSGTVNSESERQLALDIAKNADDVQMVTDNLIVKNTARY
jgi:osmotically-inducible protein OsmY